MQLTVREVAQLLGVTEKNIYRRIRERSIPASRIQEQYRFHRAEILEWATARKIAVSAEICRGEDEEAPGLADALLAGGILYRLGGGDVESVLRSAVEMMRLPGELDREQLLRVLVARERLASTGVGEGIAIPHVRNPIVLHVPRPSVTLCFLERPVDFGALDGKPVRCLFTLVSPTIRAHLHLLSRLAYALRDPGFQAVVQRQGLHDEILAECRRVEAGLPRPRTAV